MLKTFRDNLKNLAPVLWVVIAVFVLLMFAYPPGNTATQATVAATVNGHEISYAEYQQAYQNLESQFREAYGDAYNADLARQIGLPMQALNQLVAREIMLQEAEELGLQATDEEVRRTILQYPVFQDERGNFDNERYQQILRSNRFSVDAFEADTREQLLLDKFNQVLTDSVWISDAEARRQAREETESAQIRYVQLSASDIEEEQPVSRQEMEEYFAEHREDYSIPEKRTLGYLTVNNNVVRSSLEIPEEDLRAYYEENPDEFSREEQVSARHILLFVNDQRTAEEAVARLEELKARIEGGESFVDLAREFSEDEASAQNGGALGFFGRNRMTPQFEEAAFAATVGEVVGPVENQLGPRTGYHLILVEDRREGGAEPFEQVENRIRVRLLNDRARIAAEEKANELAEELAERSFASSEALEAVAADDEMVGFQATEPVARNEAIPGIGRNNAFTQAAFAVEPGTLSEPVRVAAGWSLVTAFDVQPPRIPELDEVEEQVRAAVQEEKKAEAAAQRLAEALGRVGEGGDITEVADAVGAEVQESGLIRLTGPADGITDDPEFTEQVLALDEGDFGGPFPTDGGAVVWQVNTRNRFDPETFEAEKESTLERLRQQRVNSLIQALIQRRRGEIRLDINPQLQETFELPTAGTG